MRTIQLSITTPLKSPVPVEVSGKLFYSLHDFQSKYYSYKPRMAETNASGTPQVLRFLDSENEEMECWYQNFWYDALCFLAPGRSEYDNKKAWEDLTSSIKAFTNEWGTDKGKCCITGRNPDKQLAKQAHVSCGGNVFIGIPGKTKRFVDGKIGQAVLVLDRDYPITWSQLLSTQLWKYFMHTSTVITKYNAVNYKKHTPSTLSVPSSVNFVAKRVDPFPHNQFEPTQITPVPMASYSGEPYDGLLKYGIHARIKYVLVERLVSIPDSEYNLSSFVS
jgi:hypothetical protein